MKTLQKFKARFKDGKLDEKSKVGKEKGIADSKFILIQRYL